MLHDVMLSSIPQRCAFHHIFAQVTPYTYDDVSVSVKEGALGDGLGAKLWTVAHIMCKEMVSNRHIVQKAKVLEIGSGCGLCGIVAAKLGAREVRIRTHTIGLISADNGLQRSAVLLAVIFARST